MLSNIYNVVVKGNQKAIVAFVFALIGTLGLQVGGVNVLDVTVRELVNGVIASGLTAVGVWLQANKK